MTHPAVSLPRSQPTRLAARRVTVVGAGVAGLAAACALAEAGHLVTLVERRPYVGGRASSYRHPGTDEVIDNCQHILLGCCTNLLDFFKRLDVLEKITWFDRFTYIEPSGRRSVLAPAKLPAPLHTLPAFLSIKAFSLRDKLAIARGLLPFLQGLPPDTAESFGAWCVRHRQTPGAIKRFWEPILASALNDDLHLLSVHDAGKVIRDSFLSSAEAGRFGVPNLPLSELYSAALNYLAARGGAVHLRASIDAIEQEAGGGWCVRAGDLAVQSDAVILALSFEAMQKCLPLLPANSEAERLAQHLAYFKHSPLTSVHLWFDREITELPHAVLLDTTIQWMYNKTRLQPRRSDEPGTYMELIVSASKTLIPMQRQQIIDLAMRELALFFPGVKQATLRKAAVTKEVRATFSPRPLLHLHRAAADSPWPGIYLAGDWTATGWPATMEGGVRSGYLAAEAFCRSLRHPQRFLVPDLPASGLMRLFSR